MRSCSSQEGYELDEAEVKQAIQLLDKNQDGLISFNEFVDWWVNEVRPLPCSRGQILCFCLVKVGRFSPGKVIKDHSSMTVAVCGQA